MSLARPNHANLGPCLTSAVFIIGTPGRRLRDRSRPRSGDSHGRMNAVPLHRAIERNPSRSDPTEQPLAGACAEGTDHPMRRRFNFDDRLTRRSVYHSINPMRDLASLRVCDFFRTSITLQPQVICFCGPERWPWNDQGFLASAGGPVFCPWPPRRAVSGTLWAFATPATPWRSASRCMPGHTRARRSGLWPALAPGCGSARDKCASPRLTVSLVAALCL